MDTANRSSSVRARRRICMDTSNRSSSVRVRGQICIPTANRLSSVRVRRQICVTTANRSSSVRVHRQICIHTANRPSHVHINSIDPIYYWSNYIFKIIPALARQMTSSSSARPTNLGSVKSSSLPDLGRSHCTSSNSSSSHIPSRDPIDVSPMSFSPNRFNLSGRNEIHICIKYR